MGILPALSFNVRIQARKLIKKSANAIPELAEDISTSVQIQADRLAHSTLQTWDQTVDRLQEAIAVGIEATQQENQNLHQQNTVNISNTTENSNPQTQQPEHS